MANFKYYGNPYTPGSPEFYAWRRSDVAPDFGMDMAPRIAGPRMDVGLAPYATGRASQYPNPGGIDSGQDLPMMYGYENTIGVPQVDPMTISPGGTNEIVGAPQTDYSGGFDTRAMEDPLTGLTMPPEYRTQSEIGAPVTDTPPELRVGTETPQTPETPKTPETGDGTAGQEKSFDAVGAATGVGQIAGGITNIVMGARALRDVDIAGAEAGVRDAYATRPGLGTPVEFYNMQKEAYDQRLMAMRVEDINRGLATNVAAAAQYGARGLGSTLAATAQAQRAQQQEILQQQRLQMSALGTLAQAREREIQRLPKDIVKPTIVTGVEALGRGNDLQKLDLFLAGANQIVGPQAVAQYVNVSDYFKRRATALGIETEGLIKSEEEIQQAIQQAQQQEMMMKLGGPAVAPAINAAQEQYMASQQPQEE